ncbi:hypothetical protein EJB05_28709 [Eragrostis curvula]|uniref:Short-chain dehydrogenase TIC 32, chloroplastic n=1 Tax=Eragrostis curvula TaxID=38414 RepID=A0A5J9UQZ1_9POAL|nr:hypothetical protein EJB05_28709 [Eragrostis curvula]
MGIWGWPWGRRGPSSFGGGSTAEEVTAGVDASHLTAIVTGATNGIGKETARVLALRGAEVIIPARTLESGLKVKESLADQVPGSKLHVMEMDLSSLSSVRSFAQSFNSSHKHLSILMYISFIAYSHSKLANILHANELARRFEEEGCNLTANSLHPGVILTNIVRYIASNRVLDPLRPVAKLFLKDIPQGAATTCYLALHPDLKDVSGKYFADCNEATPTAVARDAELAKKLWLFSEELVGTSAEQRPK